MSELSAQQMQEAVNLVALHGGVSQAARAVGLPRNTLASRYERAMSAGYKPHQDSHFEAPDLPDEVAPIDEIIERRTKIFNRRSDSARARQLIPIKISLDGPIGLAVFGDIHIDSPGSNFPLLKAHTDIVRNTEGLFAGAVGDLQDAWIGRLARLWADQGVTSREAWRLVEWWVRQLAGKLIWITEGNHDCLDTETEALTRRGWMRHDQLRVDDVVLSLDPETGEAVWHPILRRIERTNAAPMVTVTSRTIDLCVTPNHRILHRRRGGGEVKSWSDWQFTTADSLPPRFALPVSGTGPISTCALSDDEIAIAGWFLTDGGVSWQVNCARATFYQSKPAPELDRLLEAFEHRKVIRNRDVTVICGRALLRSPMPQREYKLTAAATRQLLEIVPEKGRLPAWALDLDDRQFDILLDALVAGDGTWDGADPAAKRVAVLHGQKEFLDSVQAAAVCHGWRAFLSIARDKDWRLNLCREAEWQAERAMVVGEAAPSSVVWCLTVPLGNFMVRRNGKAHFTGNCWAHGVNGVSPIEWIAGRQGTVSDADGVRMALVLPSGEQFTINCRHDFRGSSMYNAAHGVTKAAKFGWRDDVLLAGHTHVFGYNPVKDPMTGKVSHPIRVASYKYVDSYAKQNGFPDENISECPVIIFDPDEPDERHRVTVEFNTARGARILTMLRKEWARRRKA